MSQYKTTPRKIFISYRRNDNSDFVERIRDWFLNRYGRENVFMDFDSIHAGSKFAEVIKRTVQECDALVAIIGPRWIDLMKEKLVEFRDDYVRIEIQMALESNKLVVPICIKGASVPERDSLPPDLRSMLDVQAGYLDSGTLFLERIESIIASIEEELTIREEQKKEILKLDTLSPAPGLALGYYINFVQVALSSLTDMSKKVELPGGENQPAIPIVQSPEERAKLKLQIVIPNDLEFFTSNLLTNAQKQLNQATLETAKRPLSLSIRALANGEYHFVDFPRTITVVNNWIERRVRQTPHSTATDVLKLQREEIYRFELMLRWLLDNEEIDNESKTRVRILRYTPDQPPDELQWLHNLQ